MRDMQILLTVLLSVESASVPHIVTSLAELDDVDNVDDVEVQVFPNGIYTGLLKESRYKFQWVFLGVLPRYFQVFPGVLPRYFQVFPGILPRYFQVFPGVCL